MLEPFPHLGKRQHLWYGGLKEEGERKWVLEGQRFAPFGERLYGAYYCEVISTPEGVTRVSLSLPSESRALRGIIYLLHLLPHKHPRLYSNPPEAWCSFFPQLFLKIYFCYVT